MSQLDFVLPSQKVYGFDGSGSAVDKQAEIWTVSAGSGKRGLNCWREDGVCVRKRPKRSRRKMRKNQKTEAEFPAAPYNTNEFLMDEHDELQEDFRPSPMADDNVTLTENAFFDKEFSSTYADVRAERLHDMSKLQLITEYLQLEDRVDRLERRLKELGVPAVIDSRPKLFATPRHEFETPADLHLDAALEGDEKSDEDSDTPASSHDGIDHATAEKIRIFEQEISNLENANWLLRQQFDHLQHVLTNRRELCWCPAPTSSSATPPFPPASSPSSHFSSRPPSPSPSSTSSSSSSSSSASSSSSDSDNSDPDSDSDPRDSSSDSESDSDDSLSVCSTRCSCCSTDGAELSRKNVE